MKRIMLIVWDYCKNAFVSAGIGLILLLVVKTVEAVSMLALREAFSYAFIGLICGTVSKAAIEVVSVLLGQLSKLAIYLINAVVIALLIAVLSGVFFGGLHDLSPLIICLLFIIPEAASIILVHHEWKEIEDLNKALRSQLRKWDK